MASMILRDGREVARPDRAFLRDGGLYGYFYAEDEGVDQWLLWSEDTPEARDDLAREGIEIEGIRGTSRGLRRSATHSPFSGRRCPAAT